MKTTQIDAAKADQRKAAIESLKARGSASNENSVAKLRERAALLEERFALIEEILGGVMHGRNRYWTTRYGAVRA